MTVFSVLRLLCEDLPSYLTVRDLCVLCCCRSIDISASIVYHVASRQLPKTCVMRELVFYETMLKAYPEVMHKDAYGYFRVTLRVLRTLPSELVTRVPRARYYNTIDVVRASLHRFGTVDALENYRDAVDKQREKRQLRDAQRKEIMHESLKTATENMGVSINPFVPGYRAFLQGRERDIDKVARRMAEVTYMMQYWNFTGLLEENIPYFRNFEEVYSYVYRDISDRMEYFIPDKWPWQMQEHELNRFREQVSVAT